MSLKLKLSHLTPEEFEQLCYDLLREMGAIRLNWRKGTAKRGSPADQGRDIECEFEYSIAGGERLKDRRFIECKHHSRGIPPSALEGAVAWAMSERPDSLYFIVSGFLTNPAKQYLDNFKRNNRPPFRIEVWEGPDLEARLEMHSQLFTKYKLAEKVEKLNLLHPAHIEFMLDAPLATLDTLFGILDELSPKDRDEFLAWVMEPMILPRYRKPRPGDSIADLRIDPVNYSVFKEKCRQIQMDEHLLVHLIVSFTFQSYFQVGDYTRADVVRKTNQDFILFLQNRIEKGADDPESLAKWIADRKADSDTIEQRLKANYNRYLVFCDRVLRPLLQARNRWMTEVMT